jgi:hypothetical protein
MQRRLKIMRKREAEPDKCFPRKLSREMFGEAQRGNGSWREPLPIIAYEALYDRIVRRDGEPLSGFISHLTERLTSGLLRLYEKIAPRLNTEGLSRQDVMWVLVTEVFVPTVALELMRDWRNGLGTELRAESCWYLPSRDKGRPSGPVQRVLRLWMRTAGFHRADDLRKQMGSDSARRSLNRWLNGEIVPTVEASHRLVGRFRARIAWLEEPTFRKGRVAVADGWRARFTLACAVEQLSVEMDDFFRDQRRRSSSSLGPLIRKAARMGAPQDDGGILTDTDTFFAARLVQRRLEAEGKWDEVIGQRVRETSQRKCPPYSSWQEIERFKREMEWGMKPGNWFLLYIAADLLAKSGATPKRTADWTTIHEGLLDLGVNELNCILYAKRGRRAKSRRP